ncbi:HAD-IC family P-type ATPase [Corynebacterium sp. 335C]
MPPGRHGRRHHAPRPRHRGDDGRGAGGGGAGHPGVREADPEQKVRVVTVLRESGLVVGFMGDGINDAGAMRAADIGISVDTAVDVAKDAADVVLLEKDLMVLEQGIVEGRRTYANMIKYIKMTASSNFGNVFSVLAASALLPFLPMMSLHLILLNLICDPSCTAIPWDNVDREFLVKPRKWNARSIGSFMLWLGPTSSIFDFTTYLVMYFVIRPQFVSDGVLFNDLPAHYSGAELVAVQAMYIGLFQAGWFVESMWSQTLVIHMIRTPKLPFIQSRASAPLTLLTLAGIAVLTAIPFTPLGGALGFVALPGAFFAYLIPCIILYMLLATSLKKAYVRRYGELL